MNGIITNLITMKICLYNYCQNLSQINHLSIGFDGDKGLHSQNEVIVMGYIKVALEFVNRFASMIITIQVWCSNFNTMVFTIMYS